MITTINEDMIFMGGGNWVLERMLVIDNVVKYCRLSDDMFVYSPVPLSYQTETDNVIAVVYWEIGANTVRTAADDITELVNLNLYSTFVDMVKVYKDHPKSLDVSSKELSRKFNNFEEDRLKAFKEYVDSQFDILMGDDRTDDSIEKWYNKQWKIEFDGMSIEVSSDAAMYNAFQMLIKEKLS